MINGSNNKVTWESVYSYSIFIYYMNNLIISRFCKRTYIWGQVSLGLKKPILKANCWYGRISPFIHHIRYLLSFKVGLGIPYYLVFITILMVWYVNFFLKQSLRKPKLFWKCFFMEMRIELKDPTLKVIFSWLLLLLLFLGIQICYMMVPLNSVLYSRRKCAHSMYLEENSVQRTLSPAILCTLSSAWEIPLLA